MLYGLTQSAIFTWFEGTSDLDTKGFNGGTSDGLGRMSEFNIETVDVFLLRGCSWLCPLIVCFLKKINSSNPTVMSLNLAVKDDIATGSSDHYVVLVVAWDLVSLQKFAH